MTDSGYIIANATYSACHPAFIAGSILLSFLIFFATPTFAAQWTVDPATSKLTFEAEQSGEKFTGSFPKFESAIDFDEKAPDKGKITITIDMASVQTEGKDRQDALPTADWFAVKQFPTATFTSTSISAPQVYNKPGTNLYIAKGKLTIKGIAKEIELPFALHQIGSNGKAVMASGDITLNRADYSIGQGEWKTDAYIKFPVKVSFLLNATTK